MPKSEPSADVNYLLRDLLEDYQRLSMIIKNVDPDRGPLLKLYDAKTKVGALIRDFMRMQGVEVSEDDLVKILEKIPGKTAKKLRVVLNEQHD